MRFIGKKDKLLERIYKVAVSTGITNGSFCDLFAGTGSVGIYFKQKGYRIISSDVLYFSYVLQEAQIHNNGEPRFGKLISHLGLKGQKGPLDRVVEYLNSIDGREGFIYRHYTTEGTRNDEVQRMFFIPENGRRIDAIRQTVEEWKQVGLIARDEYFVLLGCLIESVPFYANVSGVYAAYLKSYDPRALKPFQLRALQLYDSDKKHDVYNRDSMKLVEKLNVDILYLDPPYNARQYGANYHLLETIAKYDDPKIKGVAGLRDYSEQKSDFCNKDRAISALEHIASTATYRALLLSYNSEGIMHSRDIKKVLGWHGDVSLTEIDYRRFRSNSGGDAPAKKTIKEQIYLLLPRSR